MNLTRGAARKQNNFRAFVFVRRTVPPHSRTHAASLLPEACGSSEGHVPFFAWASVQAMSDLSCLAVRDNVVNVSICV